MRGVIVAFNHLAERKRIVDILEKEGFYVKGTAATASSTLRQISIEDGGGLVICGSRFSDMTASQLYNLLPEDYDMLVLSSSAMGLDLSFGAPDGFFTMALPLQLQDFVSSVSMLLKTRQMYRDTRIHFLGKVKPEKTAGKTTDEKKLIESAKALLMEKDNMSESEAHRFLQKRSMESGLKIADVAKLIIDT